MWKLSGLRAETFAERLKAQAEAIYRAMYGTFARAAADITPQIAAQLYAEQYPMLGYPTLENPTK